MKIYDPLYGHFKLDSTIGLLAREPAVRRLSEVRLLNTSSPSLAALSEMRRYSHTLGVLRLAEAWCDSGTSNRKVTTRTTMQAAVLLHDAATPPFGHLFEYLLREYHGWHHEDNVVPLLQGLSTGLNTAQQLFAGRRGDFLNQAKKLGLVDQHIFSILRKEVPISKLIFGTLDLDNIDNVVRMAMGLGLGHYGHLALELARQIDVDDQGQLVASSTVRPLVAQWLELRRACYEILVYDGPTVSAQALLTEAIEIALAKSSIDVNDWILTDAELIQRLNQDPEVKPYIHEYLMAESREVAILTFDPSCFEQESASEIKSRIREVVLRCGVSNPLIHLFRDRGTFSREFSFRHPDGCGIWHVGEDSRSDVVYVFSRSRIVVRKGMSSVVAEAIASEIGAEPIHVGRIRATTKGRGTGDVQSELF